VFWLGCYSRIPLEEPARKGAGSFLSFDVGSVGTQATSQVLEVLLKPWIVVESANERLPNGSTPFLCSMIWLRTVRTPDGLFLGVTEENPRKTVTPRQTTLHLSVLL
jgi:hypothetical protein